MAAFNIRRGKVPKPYRVVIYGPEGIGKSSLAAMFPEPLFSDTEGSTLRMDVPRFEPAPTTWAMLVQQAEAVRDNPGMCKTYIIDTADWAERMCQTAVCDRAQKKGIEDFGYGKGYTYSAEEFGKLLNVLTEVHDKGVHIVLTAHAAMRKFEQPDEMGSYDRWELKMHKLVATMLKEWADMILFANYKTYVVAQEGLGKNKVQGGKRVMYTTHHPCWDAKNRDNLPDELPLAFDGIAHLFNAEMSKANPAPTPKPEPTPPPQAPKKEQAKVDAEPPKQSNVPEPPAGISEKLRELMISSQVTAEEIMYVASTQKGYMAAGMPLQDYPDDFINGWVIAFWSELVDEIKKNRENVPF